MPTTLSPRAVIEMSPSHLATVMESGHAGADTVAPTPPLNARSNSRSNARDELHGAIAMRFSARRIAFAAVAIPALITAGGAALIGDGIRRGVQTGGFAKVNCDLNKTPDAQGHVQESCVYGPKNTIIKPAYDKNDHRTRYGEQEIGAGAGFAGVGGILTGLAVWIRCKLKRAGFIT